MKQKCMVLRAVAGLRDFDLQPVRAPCGLQAMGFDGNVFMCERCMGEHYERIGLAHMLVGDASGLIWRKVGA